MAKGLVEVVDAAGEARHVRSVDAREIAAVAEGKADVVPVVAETVDSTPKVAGFPKDFPGQASFEEAGIGYHQALRLSKDELIAIDGIGAATADKILKLRS